MALDFYSVLFKGWVTQMGCSDDGSLGHSVLDSAVFTFMVLSLK